MKKSFRLAAAVAAFGLALALASCGNSSGGSFYAIPPSGQSNGGNQTVTHPVTIPTTFENGTIASDVANPKAGDTVTLTATPADGYKIDTLTVKGADGSTITTSGEGNIRTFTMPAQGVTVSATFVEVPATTYQVTIPTNFEHGTISASPSNPREGVTVTLTAAPESGYKLKTLTVTCADSTTRPVSGTGNTRQFTMPAQNVTIAATFGLIDYTVAITGGANAVASGGSATQTELTGAMTAVTYTANSGYYFTKFADYTTAGISVAWTATAITVSGTPTADTNITIPSALLSIGAKNPYAAKAVGDIVFSDGSATSYSSGLTLDADKKSKAIAVIFYVGTGLNSDEFTYTANTNGDITVTKSDTTTTRTLGVGLVGGTGLSWCDSSANAANICVENILCNVTLPSRPSSGDRNGSDNLEQMGKFLVSKGLTDDTGTPAKYPAFYFAKNYKEHATNVAGTACESGWYLPSVEELKTCFDNKATVQASFAKCGAANFAVGFYFTSSSYSVSTSNHYIEKACKAIIKDNGNTDSGADPKIENNHPVRAIREF